MSARASRIFWIFSAVEKSWVVGRKGRSFTKSGS